MNIVVIFQTYIVTPLINILLLIYHYLVILHVPYPLGFSIISLTIIIRIILYPFIAAQLRMSQKMLKIAPHASKLKEIHKNDAKRLQQETAKLYKEHGVNPALGCLPMLVQLPIIWGLYNMLFNIVSLNPHIAIKKINSVLYSQSLHVSGSWNPQFFGIPLGQTPQHLIGTMGPLILLVPVVTGALQFVQTKMMTPPKTNAISKEKKQDDFASAFQTQSLYIFPIMIGFFSFNFSFGLSLYWNTFTIFGILQQYLIKREDKQKPAIVALDIKQSNKRKNK